MGNGIKVPDIAAGDTFWHDGRLYTATDDAQPIDDTRYSVPVSDDGIDFFVLELHGGGAVLRANKETPR